MPGHQHRGTARRRLRGVRVRTTFVAVVVVGAALLAAAAGLVANTRSSVRENVRDSTELYAQDLAQQLDHGTPPGKLQLPDQDELMVQILGPDGRVVKASPSLQGRPALARLANRESADIGRPTGDDKMLAVAVTGGQGPQTVLAVQSEDVVDESTQTVVIALVVGLPLILLLVGVVIWSVVGRTLAPVGRIRREVEAISSSELHRRVPAGTSDDEIAELAATMNRMLERLEAGQLRMQRFVSDASHELRSPVATIRQHVEVALAHPDRTSLTELAETVHAENLRVQQLIDDLLLLANSDERAAGPTHPVDLDDLVFAEAARLRATTALRVDISAVSAGRVLGDPRALSRVLRNLGDNAARHATGRIAFSLAEHNGHVLAGVEDDGPGISPEDRERVFERFVRLDEGRARDDGGAGLGLSIVAQLVALHRGSVQVTPAPSGGARFELRFPRHDG